MSTDSAKLFVQKMREDKKFRNTVQNIGDKSALWKYIEKKGYAFVESDLGKAMASCMALRCRVNFSETQQFNAVLK